MRVDTKTSMKEKYLSPSEGEQKKRITLIVAERETEKNFRSN
jgi:hypothetical protein